MEQDEVVSVEAIGIVGWKNSGKTTLISRLIPALRALGLRVSTIKHVHHDVDLDHPGKDTFSHRQAGAVDVVMWSGRRWAILHELRDASQPALDDLLRHLTPVDVVLVEGLKEVPIRKLEVRGDSGGPRLADVGVQGIIAVVTDGPPDAELPTFSRDEVDAMAGFVEEAIRVNSELPAW